MSSKRLNYFLHLCILLFFSFVTAKAQEVLSNYGREWDKIDGLVAKGLTKSALAEVDKIFSAASRNSNDPQIIKSLLYKITLQQNIKEDASAKSIELLEKEMISSKEPAKSILESIAAEMYLNYFEQDRYRLYGRTNTLNFDKADIANWTADDFHKRIGDLYIASLRNKQLLQQSKLGPFDAIILKGNVRYLRPTLYDFLAYRALDYFKSDERDISRPSYAFEIKEKDAFAPVNEFVAHQFPTKDSSSLHQKALLIFRDLLAFHENDSNPDALIDADIQRIGFVYQYGVMNDKDSLYLEALQSLSRKYNKNPASAQAAFLAAQTIYNAALQSAKNDATVSPYTVRQAKQMLDEISIEFPASEGGINSRNLINQIVHAEIKLTTEKVNVPGLAFRTLITYKNFNAAYFRILHLTPDLKKQVTGNYNDDQKFRSLTSETSLKSWKQDLPPVDDYLSHSSEIKIDALPVGEYVLLASAAEDFSLSRNPLTAQYFYVSDISFINSGRQYFILSRSTGQPLEGAGVQLWQLKYDYNDRNNKLEKQNFITAGKNGYFSLPPKVKDENSNVRLEISYKKDRLFLEDIQYTYNYYNDRDDTNYADQRKYDGANAKVFLFTDRSIYRPGQLIYFKGIGVTKDFNTKKVKLFESKDSLTVVLSDADARQIDSMQVLPNEFGSINGKFRLPENKLNGRFEIDVKGLQNSSVSFSVEEYKRPKFYTEFEKVKGNYRLNDTVHITGFAKAFAGNNIDGARVNYRVTRVARFLYPWMFWRKGFPQTKPLEITNGIITTSVDGKFTIRFLAIPDLSLDKNTDPVFDYKVEADVTDINGETRSSNITVPVSYKALILQVSLPQGEIINIDSLKNISVTGTNLSGESTPSKAEVKIYKLQPPERLIRERLWDQPDKFIFTKDQYIEYFPHDDYADETKKESWPKIKLVYQKVDSTNQPSTFNLQPSTFDQGWYMAEAMAKDLYGQNVKDVKYFQVYDAKTHSLPAPSYIWNFAEKNLAEPGESTHLMTGTSAKDVFLIEEINRQPTSGNQPKSIDNTNDFRFTSLNNNSRIVDFIISENDRGGFGINQFFVKDNRFYVASNSIYVPWSNKELNISFDTYRDKTLPGSDEKWKVTISGKKGEKVAAEMLVSMYDASLDQFRPHSWRRPDIWPTYSGYNTWLSGQNFTPVQSIEKYWSEKYIDQKEKKYDVLNYMPGNLDVVVRVGYSTKAASGMQDKMLQGKASGIAINAQERLKDMALAAPAKVEERPAQKQNEEPAIDQSQIQIRKNFKETAFFFPELRTDKDGNIEFSFTMPEALTQWKLMALAHTKDLASGYTEKAVVTQKDLMIQPDAPRFLREGDRLDFSAKIVNLTGKELTGQAEFQLSNASTMNSVDGWFKNIVPSQYFTAPAGQSTVVKFSIEIPYNFNNVVVYRIVANAGNTSDGEEAAIAVVTNRALITETMPLPVRRDTTKDFKLEKLVNSGKSETLTHYGLTVEYTNNPAWYAVQALPYLMDFPYECAEQNFNRYYANSLATKIVNSSQKIKAIFDTWKTADTSALLSNLQKNEELKSVLLEETPWVLQAQSEEQQKKNIALLFDMGKMSVQLDASLNKLTDMQSANGGFVWFKGGPDDRYITQYIVTGIGHLKKLAANALLSDGELKIIIDKAIPYLDMLFKKDYDNLIKYKSNLKNNNLSALAIQYLYMRSFFPEYAIQKETQSAYSYYREQCKKYWLSQGKYMQAMIALSLLRTKDPVTPVVIIKSLKENSIDNNELGMYWKEWNRGGYWWYEAPVESQAMMIEAFSEIGKDPKTIDDLKTWLLKNKQTNNWHTTKATADACYALLLQGGAWLGEEKTVTLKIGNITFNSKDEKQEAGTGYFKRKIDGDRVTPEMGNINVTVSSPINQLTNQPINQSASWGAIYWQYFENLDKVTFSETPLKLSKKLFVEKNSDKGPVLIPINEGTELKVGDKIKVRIELRVDRDMEYVHMKDMRASCMEPVNVISQYKYQGGLAYYETTKDVSTSFFFNYLNKGSYVFEYPVFVTHSGNFSNGITNIQCMYAPEFTAHSEGTRVNVVE